MSGLTFAKATKRQRRARVLISAPAGAGKTYTALTWGRAIGGRLGVVDTEHGSALDYADLFDFDHMDLQPPYTVDRYTAALAAAAEAGIGTLIVDSLSHAWAGKGGLLELVDEIGAKNNGDKFGAGWRVATPKHLEFIEALLSFPGHLICTARAKMDYQLQQNDRGKWSPVKLGLAPVQRDGLEYEFAIVAEMTVPDNVLTVTKSRCAAIPPGTQEVKPDETIAKTLLAWLDSGAAPAEEDRPTIADLVKEAFGNPDPDDVLRLYQQAERFHLLPAAVTHPESEEEMTLGELLKACGREARTRAEQVPA